MSTDIKRMLKLAGVKLNENADYDFGHIEPRTQKVTAIASKPGQANLPVRQINNQGDNPMVDEDDMEPVQGEEQPAEEQPQSTLTQGQSVTRYVDGMPSDATVQFAGKMFVTYRDADGSTNTVPRSEFEASLQAPVQETEEEVVDEGVMDIIKTAISPEVLERLHNLLHALGIHDSAIINGDVQLTPTGYTKLAHKLSKEAMSDADAKDYCKHAIHQLSSKLEEHQPHVMDESDEHLNEFIGGEHRFSYVTDTMGNVQISDAVTGASVYLQGQDAQECLGALDQCDGNEEMVQHVLSQYEHVMDGQLDAEGNEIGLNF